MPENRFFIETPFQKDEIVELTGDEFHHLNVMRRKKGDAIQLVNGRGELAKGTLQEIAKRDARIEIHEIVHEPKSKKNLILAQSIVRLPALEMILEKGTELGVTEFWLFPATYTEKKELSEHQNLRLRHMTISALKQCGRVYLPPIEIKPSLAKWSSFEGQKFFGDLRVDAPYLSTCRHTQDQLIFFVGPERGFSDDEVFHMEKKLGAKGVRLHENTLRVDTAAICASILLSTNHLDKLK